MYLVLLTIAALGAGVALHWAGRYWRHEWLFPGGAVAAVGAFMPAWGFGSNPSTATLGPPFLFLAFGAALVSLAGFFIWAFTESPQGRS